MKKAIIITISLALAAHGGVPVKWSVDTFKVRPLAYEAYHGETLDLEAELAAYGEPIDLAGKTATLYWQTNGMGSAWWTTNATVRANGGATNILAATLHGSTDTGAAKVRGFLGVAGENYRAEFEIRYRSSPGFEPNVLPLPVTSYDARLYGTPTVNGTNLTEWVHARSQEETDPLAYGIATNVVTNVVTKSYVEALGITGGGGSGGGVTTNAVKSIIDAETGGTNGLAHASDIAAATNAIPRAYITDGTNVVKASREVLTDSWHIVSVVGDEGAGEVVGFSGMNWSYMDQGTLIECTAECFWTDIGIVMEDAPGWYATPKNDVITPGRVSVKRGEEGPITLYSASHTITIRRVTTLLATTNDLSAAVAPLPTYAALTNAAGAVATNVYAAMPTTYAATNAVVALNQSVQYAVASGTEIAITPPSAVAGGVRDWVLYLNGTAETALDLSAFSGLLAADAAYTNAVASNVVTVLYFSEITNGVFHLSRQELTPVK